MMAFTFNALGDVFCPRLTDVNNWKTAVNNLINFYELLPLNGRTNRSRMELTVWAHKNWN